MHCKSIHISQASKIMFVHVKLEVKSMSCSFLGKNIIQDCFKEIILLFYRGLQSLIGMNIDTSCKIDVQIPVHYICQFISKETKYQDPFDHGYFSNGFNSLATDFLCMTLQIYRYCRSVQEIFCLFHRYNMNMNVAQYSIIHDIFMRMAS